MDQIVKLIKIISNQIDAKMQILLEKTDLTSQQVRMLHYIMHHDCHNQKQICETFKLSSATVNGILNRLEEKGFIEREKLADKRNNKIIATNKALLVNETFQKAVDYNNQIMAKGLTENNVSDLVLLLTQILENIEEGTYGKNTI